MLTFLNGDVNFRRSHVGNHVLVSLGRVVEQLDQELAGLAVLAAGDHRHLVELLSHHAAVVQRIFKAVPGIKSSTFLFSL